MADKYIVKQSLPRSRGELTNEFLDSAAGHDDAGDEEISDGERDEEEICLVA